MTPKISMGYAVANPSYKSLSRSTYQLKARSPAQSAALLRYVISVPKPIEYPAKFAGMDEDCEVAYPRGNRQESLAG
jgi:hypothetical protein